MIFKNYTLWGFNSKMELKIHSDHNEDGRIWLYVKTSSDPFLPRRCIEIFIYFTYNVKCTYLNMQ